MKILTIILFFCTAFLMTGCSGYKSKPVITADSTIIYPPNDTGNISASITLCKKISKKTGKPIGEGTVFSIGEKEMVRALIKIDNRQEHNRRIMMFHIDWIDPEGNSFYMKRIYLPPDDTSSILASSVSIDSASRQPGKYLLQLYYFRELIAEKKFVLIHAVKDTIPLAEKFGTTISFFGKADKKTGKRSEEDTVFTIRKGGWIHASIEFKNIPVFDEEELRFKLDWIGPDDTSVYKKSFVLTKDDSTRFINNSMSLSPESRKPGKYCLRVTLSGVPFAEKKFVLIHETPVSPKSKVKIPARISFCQNVDKQTGERKNVNTVFSIASKGKVYAFVDFINPLPEKDKELKFKLDWIGPDNKSFFDKQVEILPGDSSKFISGSISISPDKRLPGKYLLRVYLSQELIAEEEFELVP